MVPPDLDTWNTHCVANRADDSRVIFDVNYANQILTWVVQDTDDGSPTYELIWHFDYGTSGATENRLTGVHYPSNCTAYDESSPYSVTLSSSAGVIYSLDYDYATDTYDGYLEKLQIQEGTSGTPNTIYTYGRTISERADLATTLIVYESTGEADGRTTTLSHTFYDAGTDKVQLKELSVTHPSVSSGKNGPDASAVTYQFFDKRTGALRWAKDGEGYVNFYAYDIQTGVLDLTVVDVNTSTLMTAVDDNWDGTTHADESNDDDVPTNLQRSGSGTALDIDSSKTIDWLGRMRKSVDAEGMITYVVYKDDDTRVYPAWDTGTELTLLPIQISLTDKDGRVEQSIQLGTSFDPDVTSNEPDGTTSYSNTDMVAWTVNTYNRGGALSSSDRYHDIPSSGSGTRYTNFYRTSREYDDMGRVEYTIADVADESTYDREQVSQFVYDFLGRRTEVKEGRQRRNARHHGQ